MTHRFRILFTLSIVLNVLLLGALGGLAAHAFLDPGNHAADMERLTPAGRQLVRTSFEESRKNISGLFADARAARAKVLADLNADPFDSATFLKDSQTLRDDQNKILAERARVAASVAAQLSAGDRRTMAEWLGSIHPPGDKHKVCAGR